MKLITRCREWERPSWWLGNCYFDYRTREVVMAPVGLHLVIRAWWGFCLRYWNWARRPCFLDDRLREAFEAKRYHAHLEAELAYEKKRVAALMKALVEKSEGGAL